MTLVAQALARHLGIDLSSDGIQARNRRGIAVIVHGPPGSGKGKKNVGKKKNIFFYRKNNDIT